MIDGRDGKVIGTGWRSLANDLHVRSERELKVGEYRVVHVKELFDIQLGVEPPQDAFGIPKDFQVVDR